jgi:hypothetical protein
VSSLTSPGRQRSGSLVRKGEVVPSTRLGPFCANAGVASQDVEIAIVVQHGNVGS